MYIPISPPPPSSPPPSQDRAGTNSPLEFEVVGGWEVGHPIFVHNVEPQSLPDKAGLRLGDQVGVASSPTGTYV